MELTVYRQSKKERPDGTIVYKGEDARPYIDGQTFFVADGLGGAASIRHQKIKQELFDEDKVVDVLFKGVFQDYSNEKFVKYVKDSFYEFFAVKNCYTENVNNIKKSGYFASRIVTAIFLHEMMYNQAYSAQSIFQKIDLAESEEKKKNVLDECSKHFKELIQGKLRQIAKNANIIYESSYSGLALLGSTLCATIYLEKEDCVNAIYLTAGDSRPYAWDEKDGLCQVLPDEEGKDGGMTNYIRANEDSDFYIRTNFMQFKKPCVLFNASDGCFDSGKFISQMAFEKLFVESIVESNSIEEVQDKLTEFFIEFGRHDDSSTIALKTFGFDTFEVLKTACLHRKEVLERDFLSKMGDVLDVDYALMCEEAERGFRQKLGGLKSRFSDEPTTKQYCETCLREGKFQPFIDENQKLNLDASNIDKEIESSIQCVKDIIAANFIKFHSPNNNKLFEAGKLAKIEKLEEDNVTTKEDYLAKLKKYREDFDSSVTTLSSLLDEVYSLGVPNSFEDYDEIAFQIVEKCERDMDNLFAFFNGLKNKKLDIVTLLTRQRREYTERNKKIASNHKEEVDEIAKKIISKVIEVASLDILEDDKAELSTELQKIEASNLRKEEIEKDVRTKVLTENITKYWEQNYIDIIYEVISSPNSTLSAALAEETKTLIDEYKAATTEIKEKCELQKDIFDKYDKTYNQYIGG